MTRVAILTPSITTGDAVGNDVFGMHEALTRRGHEARIYAEGWSSFDGPQIWPAPKIESFLKGPEGLLVYHYSRGWDFGLKLLRGLRCRTAIKYHNVTPPEFFTRYNEDLARMCAEGRRQLTEIARAGCDVYMSASAYNEGELLNEGVDSRKSFVVPPFHHIDRLNEVAADRGVLKEYGGAGVTNILMVGRVAPNKGHLALIEAFAAYHRDYNPESRLLVVGKEETRLSPYGRMLRQAARFLKVDESVVFAGEVTDAALKAYYSVADVFMITSEHEGFCVPLVEAMSMKLPIVAYGSSAIPGTVGGVGLVWPESDPYLMAESVDAVVRDRERARSLGLMGWRRYEEHFTNEKIEAELMRALGGLL